MAHSIPLIVFTDLDGTLIDHDNYDWRPAKPALDALKNLSAAVVMASSKTAPEIGVLQAELGLEHWPAIVENGAGILEPSHGLADASGSYAKLRELLNQVPAELRVCFEGFGDMSCERVVEVTGLSADAAVNAQRRHFSEPGLWSGGAEDRSAFSRCLSDLGVSAREGGRFLTLSFGKTKADRMAEIIRRYTPLHTVALGDAPNDIEMLQSADFGVVIANHHREPLPVLEGEEQGRIVRTDKAGPEGWNRAMLDLIKRLELH